MDRAQPPPPTKPIKADGRQSDNTIQYHTDLAMIVAQNRGYDFDGYANAKGKAEGKVTKIWLTGG